MGDYLYKIWGAALVVLIVSLSASAQSLNRRTQHETHVDKSIELINHASKKLDSLARKYSVRQGIHDSVPNPYLFALMGRPALYPQITNRLFALPERSTQSVDSGYLSAPICEVLGLTDALLVNGCLYHPSEVLSLDAVKTSRYTPSKELPPMQTLTQRYGDSKQEQANVNIPMDEDLGIVVRRPNFWTFKTNFSLQFTQNYVSDNWYKGGESHNALLAATVIEANYNNQRRLTFDNKLEMKLGFQTSHNDEKHKYKTNSDLLRLTNKLGYRAVKHWYYTAMLQSWTQFFKGYKANDERVYSDFMSPFESLLSLGMDYQQTTRNNRFKINATLSPLALKLKYVDRSSLVTSFGLDEGKHAKWEYGSNITMNYNWNIVKNISWSGRIYFFTDYSSTQIEWENTFNLAINRYLSTKLFLYPRFDDSRTRKNDQSNFEFYELLSLGLNLNF